MVLDQSLCHWWSRRKRPSFRLSLTLISTSSTTFIMILFSPFILSILRCTQWKRWPNLVLSSALLSGSFTSSIKLSPVSCNFIFLFNLWHQKKTRVMVQTQLERLDIVRLMPKNVCLTFNGNSFGLTVINNEASLFIVTVILAWKRLIRRIHKETYEFILETNLQHWTLDSLFLFTNNLLLLFELFQSPTFNKTYLYNLAYLQLNALNFLQYVNY